MSDEAYVVEICGDDDTKPSLKEGVRECILSLTNPDSPCGFHLFRTHWDPFPWVGKVEENSAAYKSGLKTGDCLLRINDHSLLGSHVATAAQLVKGSSIRLYVWNAGTSDKNCKPDSLCCSPMPSALQKLTNAMSKILNMLECPVCMDTIQPPANQCPNGHIICLACRAKADKCPICRIKYGRGRSLIADEVFTIIEDAFNLNPSTNSEINLRKTSNKKLREKLFGHLLSVVNKSSSHPDLTTIGTNNHNNNNHYNNKHPKNKLLSRLLGKAHSVDNLTNIGKSSKSLQEKSLSSNELFLATSNLTKPFSLRPASYHGSHGNLFLASSSSSTINNDDHNNIIVRYHCPLSCESLLLSYDDIIKHLKQYHSAKYLINIYENKFEITSSLLPLVIPLCFFIYDKIFFVQKLNSHWRASILCNQETGQNYELIITDNCNNITYEPVLSLAKGLRPTIYNDSNKYSEDENKSWTIEIRNIL